MMVLKLRPMLVILMVEMRIMMEKTLERSNRMKYMGCNHPTMMVLRLVVMMVILLVKMRIMMEKILERSNRMKYRGCNHPTR